MRVSQVRTHHFVATEIKPLLPTAFPGITLKFPNCWSRLMFYPMVSFFPVSHWCPAGWRTSGPVDPNPNPKPKPNPNPQSSPWQFCFVPTHQRQAPPSWLEQTPLLVFCPVLWPTPPQPRALRLSPCHSLSIWSYPCLAPLS